MMHTHTFNSYLLSIQHETLVMGKFNCTNSKRSFITIHFFSIHEYPANRYIAIRSINIPQLRFIYFKLKAGTRPAIFFNRNILNHTLSHLFPHRTSIFPLQIYTCLQLYLNIFSSMILNIHSHFHNSNFRINLLVSYKSSPLLHVNRRRFH